MELEWLRRSLGMSCLRVRCPRRHNCARVRQLVSSYLDNETQDKMIAGNRDKKASNNYLA
jgi:hypothetical protein